MKSNFSKPKITSVIVAVLLLSSMILALPIAIVHAQTNIQSPNSQLLPSGVTPGATYKAIPYISFTPNPVGVGQPILVNLWLQPPIYDERIFYNAYQVVFTKPDGTTDTYGPISSYAGDTTAYFYYTPDQAGNWTVQFNFLGGYFPAGNYTFAGGLFTGTSVLNTPTSIYYAPASSPVQSLTVATGLTASWPASPLPTSYWSRPVYPENREWWPILGSWPSTGIVGTGNSAYPSTCNPYQSNYDFTPYVTGPTSSHVNWRTQEVISGMIGGTLGQLAFYAAGNGLTYPPVPSIIYDGRGYMTYSQPGSGVSTVTMWECFNIQTGQVIWQRPLATGESAPNQVCYIYNTIEVVPGNTAETRGTNAFLQYCGGGRLIEYDPNTGAVVSGWNISISPLTSGTFWANGQSAPCFYSIQTLGSGATTQYRLINWTITGTPAYPDLVNRQLTVVSNVSWPFSSIGTADYQAGVAVSFVAVSPAGTGATYGENIVGVQISSGAVLWNITTDTTTGTQGFFCAEIADHGLFAARCNDGSWHAWNLQNGQVAWVSPLSTYPWGAFGAYGCESAYGLLLYPQYDGLTAYNWTNGQIAWQFDDPALFPYETDFANNEQPFYTTTIAIANGIIYASNAEHPPTTQPLPRGWQLCAINATTGTAVWELTGDWNANPIEDGYLVASNSRDGYLYGIGAGQSATTVSAPSGQVTTGQTVTITGSVLDESPATATSSQIAPGQPVACVSDSSMNTWMNYLYMQEPITGYLGNATVTGVPVSIDAIDPNGNFVHIATVTSDGTTGTFGYTWTPTVVGTYKITATFGGDDSYGGSWAATYASVAQAASSTVTPTPAPTTAPSNLATTADLMTYIVAVGIAIIIAVAIVGAILYRKH